MATKRIPKELIDQIVAAKDEKAATAVVTQYEFTGSTNIVTNWSTIWKVGAVILGLGAGYWHLLNRINDLGDYKWTLFDMREWAAQEKLLHTNVPDADGIYWRNHRPAGKDPSNQGSLSSSNKQFISDVSFIIP